jgi:hypothetical protein
MFGFDALTTVAIIEIFNLLLSSTALTFVIFFDEPQPSPICMPPVALTAQDVKDNKNKTASKTAIILFIWL